MAQDQFDEDKGFEEDSSTSDNQLNVGLNKRLGLLSFGIGGLLAFVTGMTTNVDLLTGVLLLAAGSLIGVGVVWYFGVPQK